MENIVLEKINFVNGKDQGPAIKAETLNQMQQNTENAINEVVPIITGIEENTENNNSDIAEAKINIENNTKNILEINNFIENSMKTLSEEGTSIHVNDSADYPCGLKIEGKSEQTQTEQGKNLLPINIYEFESNVSKSYTQKIFLKKDVSYKFSYKTEGINIRTYVKNDDGITIAGAIYTGATINVENDGVYTFASDRSSTEVVKGGRAYDIQLEEGTTATEFEPFTPDSPSPNYRSPIENVSGDLVVKVVGKNLVTLDGLIKVGNANVIKENGKYLIQSNSANPVKLSLEDLKLTNDYTIRFKIQALSNFEQFINFSNALNGSEHLHIHGSAIVNETIKLFTARFTTNELYIYVGTSASATNFQFYLSDFEIVEGSYTAETMPEFEPYKEQVVTFPLGEQKLMKDGYLGDDGIHNKRIQIVLTGNEEFLAHSQYNTTNYNCYRYVLPKAYKKATNQYALANALCSHLKIKNWISFYSQKTDEEGFTFTIDNNSTLYIKIDKSIAPTSNDLKAYLSAQNTVGTPVVIEYELEEEETTAYTSTQQTAYNALQKLKTYRTVTNISNNQNTNMVLTYKKDLQTQLQEMETMLLESGV